MEAVMKCFKCGKPVSEEEFRKRYEWLASLGIVAIMLPMCKECREGKEDAR